MPEPIEPEQKGVSNDATKSLTTEVKHALDDTTKCVVSEEKDASQQEDELREDEWMVRPCELYKEEYDDCKSIRARFHQYFVHGKTIKCSQWKTDYENCYLWSKYKSEKAYEELIKSEKNRRLERLKGHYLNNVWTRRDKPPENWNAPLPQWMQDKFEHSFLKYMSDELKNSTGNSSLKSSCTIL
ncbi:uncharacterized protein LOC128872942 [Hylaeus volcanicus]|uniref:uncharacterized protein LOC128872942 n=1 Tax=Hylaeus volcanicus TaxID=313075 RepID=UPI0023B86481|nr:uncharacterized protein LOC128872942 [Hylaeus volcanicus]